MLYSFRGLKPFQLSEFILLIAYAFVIPFSWRIATYVMIAIFITTILRGVFEEGFKINKAQYNNKFVYFIFIAFWLLYAVSFLYSDNTFEARILIGRKLSFLLFPIFFLCSDLSYLTKDRIKTILYFFVFGILTLFFVNLIWTGYDVLIEDKHINIIELPSKFFKTNTNSFIFTEIHRAYFSILTCFALEFCLKEIFTTDKSKNIILNTISIITLIFLPLLLASRAGILCTISILFIIWIWISFIKKNKKIGIITGILMVGFIIGGYFAFPKSIDRFTQAIKEIKEGKGEIRLTLRKSTKSAICENFIWGTGIGDKNDEIMKSFQEYKDDMVSKIKHIENSDLNIYNQDDNSKYKQKYIENTYKYVDSIIDKNDYDDSPFKEYLSEYNIIKHCIKHELNTHNQFSDTIIAVGMPGFILYLMMLSMPLYLWIKNKKLDILFFSLTFIMAFNSLFESVMERQMGIMFFVFFYFLLFHNSFCQSEDCNNQQDFVNLNH